jgi:zinc resistance-associated protein
MMKKTLTIMGALLLVAAVAYPVLAWGPGWGGMHQGMGWGHGPGYCWNGGTGNGSGTLNQEQGTKLDQLQQNFYNDTAPIRNELWNKSRELNTALNAANPDRARITALQSEINDLRAKMSQKRLDFELEARKIAPNTGVAGGYGPGYGRGGWGMMGYGHGPGIMGNGRGYGNHRGGFGGGPCWN